MYPSKYKTDTYDKDREEIKMRIEQDAHLGVWELIACVLAGAFAVIGIAAVTALVSHGVID